MRRASLQDAAWWTPPDQTLTTADRIEIPHQYLERVVATAARVAQVKPEQAYLQVYRINGTGRQLAGFIDAVRKRGLHAEDASRAYRFGRWVKVYDDRWSGLGAKPPGRRVS